MLTFATAGQALCLRSSALIQVTPKSHALKARAVQH